MLKLAKGKWEEEKKIGVRLEKQELVCFTGNPPQQYCPESSVCVCREHGAGARVVHGCTCARAHGMRHRWSMWVPFSKLCL